MAYRLLQENGGRLIQENGWSILFEPTIFLDPSLFNGMFNWGKMVLEEMKPTASL